MSGVRWGVIGTANIARGAFLPALRAAGGVAAAVAGRDLARTEQYARANGVQRAIEGYENLIEDPDVDALYIALPNALHAQWTISALEAGKPVLCEKPLCGVLADTERVLETAKRTGTLLWEAFVFPFNEHMRHVRSLLEDGAIGELREIQSDFHFRVNRPDNIRMSADLEGGALRDVGCYPVRLAQEFFGEHDSAWAACERGGGVDRGGDPPNRPRRIDIDTWGSLGYPGGRRLLLSCGMRRGYDTFSRLLGTTGQIHLSNPFHPGPGDQVTLHRADADPAVWAQAGSDPSFTPALRHINAVLAGTEQPRLLALETSLATARALHDLAASFGGSPQG